MFDFVVHVIDLIRFLSMCSVNYRERDWRLHFNCGSTSLSSSVTALYNLISLVGLIDVEEDSYLNNTDLSNLSTGFISLFT